MDIENFKNLLAEVEQKIVFLIDKKQHADGHGHARDYQGGFAKVGFDLGYILQFGWLGRNGRHCRRGDGGAAAGRLDISRCRRRCRRVLRLSHLLKNPGFELFFKFMLVFFGHFISLEA